ncbi:MAG: hypothetical protein AVO35_04410 [Candidatus Aegiribacteria sp. MLS_C]|nr:MAG: hypothetical protein AVO35_04410 [Candidatus Aegiribacteria sp. MLS_C]
MNCLLLLASLIGWSPAVGRATPLEYCDPDELDSPGPSGIPVLMYHHVSDPVNGYYGVSTHRFRTDLAQLDRAGFCLIGPDDIGNGLMTVPPDRRPVMLTFDDGWQDNFSFTRLPDGSWGTDPSCALAILEEYCEDNPDFGHGAVFFISWDKVPFGQEEFVAEKMNLLLDMGYTVGNHTFRHASFMRLPAAKWEEAVVRALQRFRSNLGIRTWTVDTLAYPGGMLPRGCDAEEILAEMQFDGRNAVTMGFLANGSVSSMASLLSSENGWFRLGRLDMSQYSVAELLRWSNLMQPEIREDLHDPLSRRILRLSSPSLRT